LRELLGIWHGTPGVWRATRRARPLWRTC